VFDGEGGGEEMGQGVACVNNFDQGTWLYVMGKPASDPRNMLTLPLTLTLTLTRTRT